MADLLAEILREHPGCWLAAVTDEGACSIRTRGADAVWILSFPPGFPAEAAASAAYLLLAAGPLPPSITVDLAGQRHVLRVSQDSRARN
jgi:hypothetical protein